MNAYSILLSVHVVTAILGLGQIAGTVIVASSTRIDDPVAPGTVAVLRRLGFGTFAALVIMLISGALLDLTGGGAFHTALWFRLSFALLIALGALQGVIRRALRKAERTPNHGALRRVARLSGVMCAVVAAVAILMEAKP
jgi:hypothetical protein